MNKKKCIIIDLEGTLSDHSGRAHYYQKQDYERYNAAFIDDPINEEFRRTLGEHMIAGGPDIIICTAKSEIHTDVVEDWLKKNGLFNLFSGVYFRDKLDLRSSALIKKDQLVEIQKKYDVICAYDDRSDNVDMYRKNGVKAYLVESGYQNHTHSNMTGAGRILAAAANLHMEKNKEYGNGYKSFGEIMMGLFPDGIEIKNQKDASRFAILNIMVAKLDRYCKNFNKGGHSDSLKDISVYAAMLQEVDNES